MNPTVAIRTPPLNGRVLVVEDDPEFSALIGRWLGGQEGIEVRFADHEAGGRRLLEDGRWDLLISDIELGDGRGLDLLRHAKQIRPESPALLMTAHRNLDYAIDALRFHADEFLVKPFDKTTFMDRMAVLLAKAHTNAAKAQPSILAIGAHPDDVEIGCGGYLLRHRDAGARLSILTLTDGEHGGPRSRRAVESANAARLLRADLRWGGLSDTQVSDGKQTISVIERAIADTLPETIIVHSKNDSHQDHRNAHMAALVAARSVPNVICYQSPSATLDFRPQLFVDIGTHMDGKIELIDAYASQVSTRPYLDADVLRTTARYWGRFAGYREVEPFEVIRGTN